MKKIRRKLKMIQLMNNWIDFERKNVTKQLNDKISQPTTKNSNYSGQLFKIIT